MSLFNILGSFLTSAIISYVIWRALDPRLMLFFIFFLAIAEVFIQFRRRMSLVCSHCGFDPILYLKDASLAAQKVKAHLAKRKEDPKSLFLPPLDLPMIKKAPAEKQPLVPRTNNPGKIISKQI